MAVAAVVAVPLVAHPVRAQSPFTDFAALGPAELATLQGKLTWVGPQREMVPSVGFTANGNAVDLAPFAAARQPGINYANDAMAPQTFTASIRELQALLANLGGLAPVTGGGVAANPVLSLALAQGGKVFEAVVARPDATAAIAAIQSAMPDNAKAQGVLGDIACAGGIISPSTAADVSTSVTIARSGIRLNRGTGRYVQRVTLSNGSGSSVNGPLSLVVQGLAGSVTLANKSGTTCNIQPTGSPFINSSGPLAAGASADLTLEFDNPDALEVSYTPRVFAGPGPR